MMNSKVTYRQQFTRCGKQRCRKCREGSGHGPYWYAYWSEKGHTVSKYIGVHLPEDIEADRGPTREDTHASSLTHTATPVLRIYLLGQFRIERIQDDEWKGIDSRTWHRRRARSLLGCLLSSPGRRLGREQVTELLWPDLDIDLATNRLNGAVHELRQILEPGIVRPATSRLLRLERDILELAGREFIWVDAEEFENLLKEADTSTDLKRAEQLLAEAAALYRGNYLLEELYSEWATPRRDALQRAWVGLLLTQANLSIEQEAFASALETLDRLRTADPMNETALQRLMILLTQLDRRGEALQVYRQHIGMLQRDYEGEALPETVELYETLRQGHIPALNPGYSTTKKRQIEVQIAVEPAAAAEVIIPRLTLHRPVFQPGRHGQSPLIGRDNELATMHHVMQAISEIAQIPPERSADEPQTFYNPHPIIASTQVRHRHFLLLKGESGIGKTRLAEEVSLEAYTNGWAVAWSRSYEQEGMIPYRPWTELFRMLMPQPEALASYVQQTSPLDPGQAHNTSSLKLERLCALLPELVQYTEMQQARIAPPIPHEQERLHLWEAALWLLSTLSTIHPLLFVLDDLHWADDSSIELLTYLIHHLKDQRVLLIGTCRDGELPAQHKLRSLIADLQREQAIAVVSVLPLSSAQIGSLVAHLPKEMVRGIQTQASGNPFFAEELARYVKATYGEESLRVVAQSGERPGSSSINRGTPKSSAQKPEADIAQSYLSLPEAIAAVLERRLGRLSTGCQLLLGKAAVLGGTFELRQLLPMAAEHDEDTVLDLLEEALSAGLLTEEGTGAHITYYFWHPLIISHLYSRLSAARRSQLHRRAAEAIKAAYVAQPEKAAASIVYHLVRGGGDPGTVAYYAELSGNEAYSLAAYSEAQQYYLQAINALADNELSTPENTDAHEYIQRITAQALSQFPISEPLRVCRLLEHVAECSIVLGNYAEARNLFASILDLRTSERFQRLVYPSKTHEQRQQEVQIQALLWREISQTWALTGDYERAHACNTQGQAVVSQEGITSGAAWACLHLQHGAILRFEGDYYESRRYLQEALTMLEMIAQQNVARVHTKSVAGELNGLASVAVVRDQLPYHKDIPTHIERVLNGDLLELGYAHERLGIVEASLGQLNDGLQHMLTALTIYEQGERVIETARLYSNLGATYVTKGEHENARKYMQLSLELAERAGNLPHMALVMLNLGDVAQRTGGLQEASEWVRRSIALQEQIDNREGASWCHSTLAMIQEDLGDLPAAAASILNAINNGRAIRNARCMRFALIKLADLRIKQALTLHIAPAVVAIASYPIQARHQHLLQAARSTLQKVCTFAGIEIENIIDARYLLARTWYLLGDLPRAQQLAEQTLKEAQEHEVVRACGYLHHLLGQIMAAQSDYEQAEQQFGQAIQLYKAREFRLDYAKALYSYGIMLFQHSMPAGSQQAVVQSRRGLQYLHEAREIFVTCHASLEIRLLDDDLSRFKVV